MNELALFAGAGGGILGGHLLGWRCVCAVERDAYGAAVLAQRQNDGCLPAFPIWSDVESFDGSAWRGLVDVISGGFPCQDISTAGKGAGITGERSGLWKEFARIIGEVGPRFVLVENSPALTSRGLGVVLGDLAAMGYDARWGVLGAIDAGAPHRRERIWIVADDYCFGGQRRMWQDGESSCSESSEGGNEARRSGEALADAVCDGASEGLGGSRCEAGPTEIQARWRQRGQSGDGRATGVDDTERERCASGRKDHREHEWHGHGSAGEDAGDVAAAKGELRNGSQSDRVEAGRHGLADGGADVSDADLARLEERERSGSRGQESAVVVGDWWATEPDMGRVADGVAHRVDRLRALGNGQVPSVVHLAWEILHGGRGV